MGKQATLCVIQGKAGFVTGGFNAKNDHWKAQKGEGQSAIVNESLLAMIGIRVYNLVHEG